MNVDTYIVALTKVGCIESLGCEPGSVKSIIRRHIDSVVDDAWNGSEKPTSQLVDLRTGNQGSGNGGKVIATRQHRAVRLHQLETQRRWEHDERFALQIKTEVFKVTRSVLCSSENIGKHLFSHTMNSRGWWAGMDQSNGSIALCKIIDSMFCRNSIG